MKAVFAVLFVTVLLSVSTLAQTETLPILPRPLDIQLGDSKFTLDRQTVIVAREKPERRSAEILAVRLREAGLSIKIVSRKPQRNYIEFAPPGTAMNAGPMPRATSLYGIRIEPERIHVVGRESAQFHAIQSLMQLLPSRITDRAELQTMRITDWARFPYRGMHLDISRHFQPVEFVKRFIDLMSQYKFNYFHWHLTDDQGWRIEIKKYPRLTEIGSKRPETMKERNFAPYIGDGIPHGGFYTQEQIKEVVAYAKARHITVVPEIELPGHASAAIAAYPQLGCKTDFQYKVQTTWGIFKETFCPTDETFKFLENVLDETIKLFPDSPYIHIGGDEVLKDHWKESPFVQELKKKHNLKDEHEVQSYFVQRIEKFVNSKGKKIIGWDEILEGGLAPNATVMSWRGMKGGIEAAKSKHDVIMTPTDSVYFDYGQGDPAYEPLNIGSYVPLSKVYAFEPVPKELSADEAKYVIGGQANIWTEYIKTPSHVEYMAFPRMIALAEVVWSNPEHRNFADFTSRLKAHLPHLDAQDVNYRIPEPGGLQNVLTNDEKVVVQLVPSVGTRVHYTTDGSTPDDRSPVYEKPVEIPLEERQAVTLKTIVINGAGRKSVVYAATLLRDKMREPATLGETKQGVNYEILIPREMGGDRKNGETRSILLTTLASSQGVDLKQPFAVTYDGYMKVAADGLYEFQVDSTWDATVVLGGGMLIDDVGTKDRKVKSAVIPLKAGWHKISMRYNHRGGDATLRLRWGIKGQGLNQAYGGEFVH